MARFAGGEDGAFADFHRVSRSRLLGLLRRLGASPFDAEDLLQDVYLRAYAARARFRAGQTAFPWLTAIARNALCDRRRAEVTQRRFERHLAHLPRCEDGGSAEETLIAKQTATQIAGAIGTLPDATQRAFVLHRFEGHGIEHIANDLGATKNSTKIRVCRAVAHLRHAVAAG
jgi:RNA polymerase sigma-70 factor (ECF subfamily)